MVPVSIFSVGLMASIGDRPVAAVEEEPGSEAATRIQCAERQRVARGVRTRKFWAWADNLLQEEASVRLQAHGRKRLAMKQRAQQRSAQERAKREEAVLALQRFTREKKKMGTLLPLSKVKGSPLLPTSREAIEEPSCPCPG